MNDDLAGEEARAAVAALVHRLRNRAGKGDEALAQEYVTALLGQGWRPIPAPSDDAGEGGAREAPRELIAFARATRPDWTLEETWNAVHAARTAGLSWDKLALRLTAIALRKEDPPTRPRELWDHARGLTARTGAGPATEEFRDALAALKARNTGPLQRLREQDDDAPPGAA